MPILFSRRSARWFKALWCGAFAKSSDSVCGVLVANSMARMTTQCDHDWVTLEGYSWWPQEVEGEEWNVGAGGKRTAKLRSFWLLSNASYSQWTFLYLHDIIYYSHISCLLIRNLKSLSVANYWSFNVSSLAGMDKGGDIPCFVFKTICTPVALLQLSWYIHPPLNHNKATRFHTWKTSPDIES